MEIHLKRTFDTEKMDANEELRRIYIFEFDNKRADMMAVIDNKGNTHAYNLHGNHCYTDINDQTNIPSDILRRLEMASCNEIKSEYVAMVKSWNTFDESTNNWFELYPDCPYYSSHVTDHDVIGHDTVETLCSKSGKNKSIPHLVCKHCNIISKLHTIATYSDIDELAKINKSDAYDFIKNKCNNCSRNDNCTGFESSICNLKTEYLLAKYSDDPDTKRVFAN